MAGWTKLFRFAALFNWMAGGPLLLTPATMLAVFGAAAPADLTFHRLSGLLIILFGAIYWLMASDPLRFRPLATIAVVGKLAVFALFAQAWLAGHVPNGPAALAIGDLLFGLAFALFLRRTRTSAG